MTPTRARFTFLNNPDKSWYQHKKRGFPSNTAPYLWAGPTDARNLWNLSKKHFLETPLWARGPGRLHLKKSAITSFGGWRVFPFTLVPLLQLREGTKTVCRPH